MTITIFFFWVSFALLFYCYGGYGIFVFFVNALKNLLVFRKKMDLPQALLPVTIIITAYNEEAILEQKIKNTPATPPTFSLL